MVLPSVDAEPDCSCNLFVAVPVLLSPCSPSSRRPLRAAKRTRCFLSRGHLWGLGVELGVQRCPWGQGGIVLGAFRNAVVLLRGQLRPPELPVLQNAVLLRRAAGGSPAPGSKCSSGKWRNGCGGGFECSRRGGSTTPRLSRKPWHSTAGPRSSVCSWQSAAPPTAAIVWE